MQFAAIALVLSPSVTPTVWGQLDSKIKVKGKLYFGAVTDLPSLQVSIVIHSDFGALMTLNSAKWDATEPLQGNFNFAGLDALVNYTTSNGKLVCGDTLVWRSQLPAWATSISNPATLTSVIQSHITAVISRYKRKIYAWDVVNEVLNKDGTLQIFVLSNVLGKNFVTIAFKAARPADPSAKLYINEYNVNAVNAKLNALVTLVNRLKAAGTSINGIGTKIHLSVSIIIMNPPMTSCNNITRQAGGAGGVLAALPKLVTTGSKIAITELSVAGAPSE
ncbi:hypothetical protein FRC07_004881 [Ceratobasidium sp. 392]|nr:hypothetical protein FRC07_004881 [Ceratobasidium sp. 392]